MTFPVRFSVCSYNIWTAARWPERKPALEHFAALHQPDILCLQELQSESRQTLDAALPGHTRVDDPFEGWEWEGNIYWNAQMFEQVEHGAEDIGILEQLRRLFWVRLRLLDGSNRTLFVSTAHYTWPGHAQEEMTGLNLRVPQAQKTVETLARLVPADAPMLFMGDLNDYGRPISILRFSGLTDAFGGLGRDPRFTHPAAPTERGAPVTIDWIFGRGPLRPMTAEVVDFYHDDLAPSDHKPVLATYGL